MPPRVDFYIIESAPQNPLLAVCRLLEKAYQSGQRIFVSAANEAQAIALDDLLWTFREDNFIPHQLQSENPGDNTPIVIGWQAATAEYAVLVNLADAIPETAWTTPRVIEFVTPENKEPSRLRYSTYREKNCALHTHRI
jgi:DNA polymerase-3 subunit chi